MTISFKTLCNQLCLPDSYKKAANLASIEDWCHKHISQDIQYSGDDAEKYQKYLEFAANYLNNFSPEIPQDLAQKKQFFGNQNAIHYAAQHGYDRFIAAQLHSSKAAINAADEYGMTPLHIAASQGYVFTVKALLSKGADAHKTNLQHQLPVHRALFVPMLHDANLLKRKEEIVAMLLALTPEALSMQDQEGDTLLHLLAMQQFDHLLAQVLKANSQLAFIKNNNEIFPVHTAILNHQREALDLLLAIEGGDKLGDKQNRLPIHYAALYGDSKMVASCCRNKENINARDDEGKTPLLAAISTDNQAAIKILTENGKP